MRAMENQEIAEIPIIDDNEELEELKRLRREFHQHPELGWTEFWTTARIAELLEDMGFDVLVGHDLDMSAFLDTFGQSNRDTKEANTQGVSLLQSATMLNSNVVKKRVLAATAGSRVAKLLADQPPASWWDADGQVARTMIDELFLATLSRTATDGEYNVLLEHLRQHKKVGLEDIHWSLLNQLEFVVNR